MGRGRAAGRPRKYSPVGREGIGTSTVVRGKGEGGGGEERDGHHETERTKSSERIVGRKIRAGNPESRRE